MDALSVLFVIYLCSMPIMIWETVMSRIAGDEDWKIGIMFTFLPVINTLGSVIYLWGMLFFSDKSEVEYLIKMRNKVNRVCTCTDCGINSYYGRVQQNHNHCPWCNSAEIDYLVDRNGIYKEYLNAEAPLSEPFNIRTSFTLHKKLLKTKQLEWQKRDAKMKLDENMRQVKEEMRKTDFKESQLQKYIELLNKSAEPVLKDLEKRKGDNDEQ